MAQWYCMVGDEMRGPLESAELRQLALQGEITAESSVRKGDVGEWVPARRVQGLIPAGNGSHVPQAKPPASPAVAPAAAAPQAQALPPKPLVRPAVSGATAGGTPPLSRAAPTSKGGLPVGRPLETAPAAAQPFQAQPAIPQPFEPFVQSEQAPGQIAQSVRSKSGFRGNMLLAGGSLGLAALAIATCWVPWLPVVLAVGGLILAGICFGNEDKSVFSVASGGIVASLIGLGVGGYMSYPNTTPETEVAENQSGEDEDAVVETDQQEPGDSDLAASGDPVENEPDNQTSAGADTEAAPDSRAEIIASVTKWRDAARVKAGLPNIVKISIERVWVEPPQGEPKQLTVRTRATSISEDSGSTGAVGADDEAESNQGDVQREPAGGDQAEPPTEEPLKLQGSIHIEVRLSNLNKEEPLEFPGWRAVGDDLSTAAILCDDQGRFLERAEAPTGSARGKQQWAEIPPGEDHVTELVFHAPSEPVRFLRLALPYAVVTDDERYVGYEMGTEMLRETKAGKRAAGAGSESDESSIAPILNGIEQLGGGDAETPGAPGGGQAGEKEPREAQPPEFTEENPFPSAGSVEPGSQPRGEGGPKDDAFKSIDDINRDIEAAGGGNNLPKDDDGGEFIK